MVLPRAAHLVWLVGARDRVLNDWWWHKVQTDTTTPASLRGPSVVCPPREVRGLSLWPLAHVESSLLRVFSVVVAGYVADSVVLSI